MDQAGGAQSVVRGGGLGSAVGSQGGQSTPNRTTVSGVDRVRHGALNVSANDQVT